MNAPSFLIENDKAFAMSSFRIPKRKHKEWKEKLGWLYEFPWRVEQQQILNEFDKENWQEFIIQAVFGGGKTTMIIAMLFHLVLSGQCKIDEIMISAFNVAIKNEIKKKLKVLGKIVPRTFDSIVYEICRELEYKDLKHPNFLEKRKFLYQNINDIQADSKIKYVFIDEAQDLEINVLKILKKRFEGAKLMIVGDIFQSIQKEPRESLLWKLLHEGKIVSEEHTRIVHNMMTTPRVPRNILNELKVALFQYYPEFQDTIQNWKSSSLIESNKGIQWSMFYEYKKIFSNMLDFVKLHGFKDSMILVFSSAITVRGSLGDVSRVRRFFVENDIPVNANHKLMKDEAVFISTVNSSKGLERKHVFCLLTFPLELAFANFSSDILMNLLTVGLSRCKESIHFCIPSYMDRFSPILKNFKNCPKPNVRKVQQKLCFSEKRQFLSEEKCMEKTYMLEKEHSVTEILRLQMFSFATKQRILLHVKKYGETKCPYTRIPVFTEEEASLVGLVFETLILSFWKGSFPTDLTGTKELGHECYRTYFDRIQKIQKEYISAIRSQPFSACSDERKIHISILYGKLYLAVHNKVFCNYFAKDKLLEHWLKVKSIAMKLKPANIESLKTQERIGTKFINGIVDAMIRPSSSKEIMEIFEIKASRSREWNENAMLQATLYGLSQGRKKFKVHLINLLSSKWHHYYVNFEQADKEQVMDKIFDDIQLYNLNCFLAKNRTIHNENKKNLNINDCFFLDGRINEHNQMKELLLLEINSPTKLSIVFKCSTVAEVESFWKQKFDLYKKNWNIQRLVVARHITKNVLPTFKEIDVCFLNKTETPLSFESYLMQIGWYKPRPDQEDQTTSINYMDWNRPISSSSVQISELCETFNFKNF
jgi:hypothetical protein